MSYADISDYVQEMYGMEISKTQISHITDGILAKVTEWQSRPLEDIYPIVFMDAIHFKVRQDGKIITKAVYCLLGINQEGKKELLAMNISEKESASFWMKVLNDLKNRGVQDILIACIDNLKGFKEAIRAVFPQTGIQQCVVHQIRNSFKYIAHKDSKAFLEDLKSIYKAPTEEAAQINLERLEEKWSTRYAHVVRSWQINWPELSAYFQYPVDVRKMVYTTNVIESFNSQLRKITKTKRVFNTDMGLMKLLYLVQENITKKWLGAIHNWKDILCQLAIIFGDRLKLNL